MSNVCMICKVAHPGLTCDEQTVLMKARHQAVLKVFPQVRPNIKKVCDLPEGQEVKGMVLFDGHVIVATTLGVWKLEGDEFAPIKFQPLLDVPQQKDKP